MAHALRTITVAFLRKLIENEDDDALVVFTSDYGDHCHTEQVHPLDGEVEEIAIKVGAYSQSGWVVADDEYVQDEQDGSTKLVLRIS